MKYIKSLLIAICILAVVLGGCQKALPEDKNENQDTIYYELDDFKDIVINESTIWDLHELVTPPKYITSASYGHLLKFPMSDGKCIYVKADIDGVIWDIEVRD